MSADLLNSMLDGARVTGEQHNPGAINWARGLSDPGEMISCGYMPELRRQSGEQDADYQRRLESMTMPAGLLERIKTAALKRASLGSSNGRIAAFFAGKAPWHGLGTVVDKAATSAEAIRFAGLDWRVEKMPLSYAWNGESKATTSFAIVRGDTGDALGTVGNRYAPIQNVDGFDFLDGVLQDYGARYESAGALYNGSTVWILAHMPKQAFRVNGDDVDPFVVFTNTHDGSGAAACYPTTVRVECANTLRVSSRDRQKGLNIRHTGSVQGKIKRAQEALGFAVESFERFRESAETLVNKPCEIKHYANDVLDAVLDVTAAQALKGADLLAAVLDTTEANRDLARKSFAQKIERRGEVLEDILARYDSGRCHPQGSAWAAFNAVTEHADHNSLGRKVGDTHTRASRRFESAIAGDRDEMKQVAYSRALAL